MEKNLKQRLSEFGISLKKAYGQNFLTDRELLSDIVEKAGVTSDDEVLEIGCGAGALTCALAEKAKKVVSYEIDVSLKPLLNRVLSPYSNVNVVFKDVMKEKISDIEKKFSGEYLLVANLPYYVTTPIVMNFLENATAIKGMAIMVQKEVALRFAALPKTSDYGAITVGINLRGSAEIIKEVGREMFTPPPNVDSAVVKINLEKNKFPDCDLRRVRELVRCAFSSRRKMLVNNMMNLLKMSRKEAESALDAAGISRTARGEELSAEDYVRLSAAVTGV